MDITPASVRDLADRQAITDQIYRYCRAVDRLDHELGYAVWHEGGTADYGHNFQGTGRDFIDHVCAQHAAMQCHAHNVTNILIELDGDSAGSEAYVMARLRMERDGELLQIDVQSRYLDRWSRRDGHWGIEHRQAVIEMDEIRPVTPMRSHDTARRDRGDPSYGVLSFRTD